MKKLAIALLVVAGVALVGAAGAAFYHNQAQSSGDSAVTAGTDNAPVPAIASIRPSSAPVGTVVTVFGSGFSATGNIVNFNDRQLVQNVASTANGTRLSFTVPNTYEQSCTNSMPAHCSSATPPGTYQLTLQVGKTVSNSVSFIVTTSGTAAIDSGISGIAKVGPTCPVQTYPPQDNCADKPFSTTLLIKSLNRSFQKTITSGSDGAFSIALAPGSYVISQNGEAKYPFLSPQTVVVSAHKHTSVTLAFDSGIR